MGEDPPIEQEAATPPPVAPHLLGVADDDLLRAARGGDDRAFAALIQRHDGLLTTLAHRLVSARRADDTQRAVYVKAYRALPRRPGRAARPWLIRLIYLAAVDQQRRRERRRAGGPGRKPVVDDDTGDLGHPGLASALAGLPLDQRAVVVLVDELGVEVEEVAAALGTDERVARTLLDEARRVLAGAADSQHLTGGPPAKPDPDPGGTEDAEPDAATAEGASDGPGGRPDEVERPESQVTDPRPADQSAGADLAEQGPSRDHGPGPLPDPPGHRPADVAPSGAGGGGASRPTVLADPAATASPNEPPPARLSPADTPPTHPPPAAQASPTEPPSDRPRAADAPADAPPAHPPPALPPELDAPPAHPPAVDAPLVGPPATDAPLPHPPPAHPPAVDATTADPPPADPPGSAAGHVAHRTDLPPTGLAVGDPGGNGPGGAEVRPGHDPPDRAGEVAADAGAPGGDQDADGSADQPVTDERSDAPATVSEPADDRAGPANDGEAPTDTSQPPPPAAPADLSGLPRAVHGPGFWEQLGRRLMAEREAPPAPTPSLSGASDTSATDRATRPPPVAMQKRPPRRRGRFGRREPAPADPVEGLASEARRQRVRTNTLVLVAKTAAVVVVAGLLATGVVAAIRLGSRARSPLRTESIADISRRSTAALAEADTFAANIARTEVASDGTRRSATYRLARDDRGSYLLARLDPSRVVAFDAPTATLRTRTVTVDPDGGGTVEATRETGLASGPPDPDGRDQSLPDQDLALAARALLAVDDKAPDRERIAGRAVWVLNGPLPGAPLASRPDAVELVVDRARLAPVRLSFTRAGRLVRELEFTDTVIDGPVGPFTVDQRGETVLVLDHGFEIVDQQNIEAVVGYQPPRPTYLPEGFELVSVTAEPEDGVASMRYQRGFQAVTVSIRTAPVPAGTPWPDPFERAGRTPTPTPVTLTGGAFRVVEAQRVTGVGTLASLWGSDGELAFTVSGDLPAEQLVRVAESLG